MNLLKFLSTAAAFLVTLAKDVAPGVVTDADLAFHAICKLIEGIAHPNTVAYKVAKAATDKAAELGL